MHTPTRNSFTGLYRSQGMATDGLNHIGDIDYHNGIIYASLDSTSGYTKPHVALFNASDLSYTGKSFELGGTPANPNKDLASWVAVDAKRGFGYGKQWQDGNTINVYKLSNFSFSHTLTLDKSLDRIQGAKVVGDWLYMASDNDAQLIYRSNLLTGAVEEVLRLPQPPGALEMEGLALRGGANGALDMYVEQVVDPDRSGQSLTNPNLHLALYHYQLAAVPEPATYAMPLAGVGLLAVRRRQRLRAWAAPFRRTVPGPAAGRHRSAARRRRRRPLPTAARPSRHRPAWSAGAAAPTSAAPTACSIWPACRACPATPR